MQFSNNFDLDEFLAYLLPGSLFLGMLLLTQSLGSLGALAASTATGSAMATALEAAVFISGSLILGHIFSVMSRFVWRPLLNNLGGGDPGDAIFGGALKPSWPLSGVFPPLDRFFTAKLNELIGASFEQVFGRSMLEEGLRPAVPRLIRSYVFASNERANASREQVVRSRSICANLATPLAILAVMWWLGYDWWWHVVFAASALVLLLKQRDLDLREAKEIYLFFVALVKSPSTASPAK